MAQPNPFAPAGAQPAVNNGAAVNPIANPGNNPNAVVPGTANDPSLIVRRFYEQQPSSPLELAEAILICTQIRRTDAARKFILDFEKLAISPAQATLVQQRLGSAFMFEVSKNPALKPEGTRFATMVLQGCLAYMRDSTRIGTFIDDLGSTDRLTVARARDSFKTLDVEAVAMLGAALGESDRADYHSEIQRTIIAMGQIAIEPMIGYLDVESADYRGRVVEVLGGLGNTRVADRIVAHAVLENPASPVGASARRALIQLVGAVPTRQDAVLFLQRQFDRFLAGDLMLPVDEFNRITLWKYDAQQSIVAPEIYDARVVSLILATQVSHDLYSLDLTNPQYKQQFLRSVLASSKVLNGVNQPLADGTRQLVSQESPEYVLALLRHCLDVNNLPAAVGAVEVLGDIGDAALVYSTAGRPTHFVGLLMHPSRRLRFAVANAIFNIAPEHPFPGCTFLSEAAGYFVRTAGSRKVLTGDVLPQRSQAWVGLLAQMGFSGDRAQNGRDLIKRAQQSADYEFLLIGESITNPHINDVVYMLRHDPRTAGIPIAIVIHDEEIGRANAIAAVDPLTYVLTEPTSVQGLLQQTRPLLLTARYQEITVQERLNQATVCLNWFKTVLGDQPTYNFFDAQRQQQQIIDALFTPPLSNSAAEVLAFIGSADAQRALTVFASQNTELLKNRLVAAAALEQNIRQHQLLLTRTEILNQYSLYNKSLDSPQANIDVLANILDSLESPTKSVPADK